MIVWGRPPRLFCEGPPNQHNRTGLKLVRRSEERSSFFRQQELDLLWSVYIPQRIFSAAFIRWSAIHAAVKISALESRDPKAGFARFVKKRSLFSYENQIAPISL
jgi:hypothetical protein